MVIKDTLRNTGYNKVMDNTEEWEHTYRKEQSKRNGLTDFLVACVGFFALVIVIPVFPATVIESVFPEFPSYIVCCGLGLVLFLWILYNSYYADAVIAVSVGTNGITFHKKSGQKTRYRIGQFIDIARYRIDNRGETMLYSFIINMKEDNGSKTEINCDFLTNEDIARLTKDLEALACIAEMSQNTEAYTDVYDSPKTKTYNSVDRMVYIYPRENIAKKAKGIRKKLLVIFLLCFTGFMGVMACRLYQYHGNPPFDLFVMSAMMLLNIAFIDLLFLIILPSRYMSFYPKMISRVELLPDGIGIIQEKRIFLPIETIRYIKILSPGCSVKRKFGVRKMTVHTDDNVIECYLGFHPDTRQKALSMQNYNQFYYDVYRWSEQHGIECLDDVASDMRQN